MPHVTVNNQRLHVHVGGSGPPLLFVHGFPLDHSMWNAQLGHFARTHRVIAPDLRGFGASEPKRGTGVVSADSGEVTKEKLGRERLPSPFSDADTVTMAEFADDLADLLDALPVSGPVTLCGLSMGGYIAMHFFARHRARLAALILCDCRAAPDSPEVRQGRLDTAARVLQEGPGFLAETLVARLFSEKSRRERTAIVAATQDVIRRNPPAGTAAAARGMAERPDMTSLLPQIDVPALLIVGSEDAISPPKEMHSMAAAIPNSTLVEVADAGHMAPLEDPPPVNTALERFLAMV
jgi:pimeloyl-ACP methyl ester carboxylesterase